MDTTPCRSIRSANAGSEKATGPDDDGYCRIKKSRGDGKSGRVGKQEGQGLEPRAMDADAKSCHTKIELICMRSRVQI
jgi:hypothetical protein